MPVRSAHACRRSAKLGEDGLHQQHRALAQRERRRARRRRDHGPLRALLDRAQQPPALSRLDVLQAFDDHRPLLECADQRRLGHHLAHVEVAHVDGDQRTAERGRQERVGVRAGEHDREVALALEQRGDDRHRLVAAGCVRGQRDHPQAGRLRGLVHPPAEQHRREPVGHLHRALGQRRLRIAHQLQRAEPAQPSVGVERGHHVGRTQPFALEQLADEPRARQLARDVVLQVGVQAAVARVELGRRAYREHRGLQQIQAERLDRALQALVGVRRRLAVREPQRDLVGDVQAAERIARIRIRARDPLDRRHHAAVDEAEGDRGLLRFCHYGAILSATSSASRSIESPGFETVSGPLVGAPRCCTTCASSCAISLSPSEVLGLYWSCAK